MWYHGPVNPLARVALVCSSLLPLASGCKHAMCDPQPVGAPWRAYQGLLPANAVVCGPNRVSAAKPSKTPDDYPPTQLFVFYRDADVRAAYDATIDRFKYAGWTVSHEFALGGGSDALRAATVVKGGVEVKITVNRNDWGVQGSYELRPPATP